MFGNLRLFLSSLDYVLESLFYSWTKDDLFDVWESEFIIGWRLWGLRKVSTESGVGDVRLGSPVFPIVGGEISSSRLLRPRTTLLLSTQFKARVGAFDGSVHRGT